MIPLFKPYMPEDVSAVESALKSGQLAAGNLTIKFEHSIGSLISNPYVIATNSFNSALLIALRALDVYPGSEIIASPMGCLASLQPLIFGGYCIKWADIDPTTGTLLPSAVEQAITSETKAILHNHFCGYPGRIDEVNEIAGSYSIPVIDDAIEAFGSRYKGHYLGCCGTDCSVFSFSAVRLPNTIDGGAMVFKREEDYQRARLICDLGINRQGFRDGIGEIDPLCDVSMPGMAARASNVCSQIGLLQMPELEAKLSQQRKNAEAWASKLDGLGAVPLEVESLSEPNYWVYGVLSNDKRKLIERCRALGLYASGVHINMNRYSIFNGTDRSLTGAHDFYDRFLAVPSGWWCNIDELNI